MKIGKKPALKNRVLLFSFEKMLNIPYIGQERKKAFKRNILHKNKMS